MLLMKRVFQQSPERPPRVRVDRLGGRAVPPLSPSPQGAAPGSAFCIHGFAALARPDRAGSGTYHKFHIPPEPHFSYVDLREIAKIPYSILLRATNSFKTKKSHVDAQRLLKENRGTDLQIVTFAKRLIA